MTDDRGRIQKLAEVTLSLQRCGKRVHKSGVDGAVIIETVYVEEPERLAGLRNRSAHRGAPVVLGQWQFLIGDDAGEEEISGVQFVVAEKIVQIAVELVGAG